MAMITAYDDVTDVLVVRKSTIFADIARYQIVYVWVLCNYNKHSDRHIAQLLAVW